MKKKRAEQRGGTRQQLLVPCPLLHWRAVHIIYIYIQSRATQLFFPSYSVLPIEGIDPISRYPPLLLLLLLLLLRRLGRTFPCRVWNWSRRCLSAFPQRDRRAMQNRNGKSPLAMTCGPLYNDAFHLILRFYQWGPPSIAADPARLARKLKAAASSTWASVGEEWDRRRISTRPPSSNPRNPSSMGFSKRTCATSIRITERS